MPSSKPIYPDEYEYLRWLVRDRHFTRSDETLDPLQDQIRELLATKQTDQAIALECEVTRLKQVLMDERIASEDIINWLYWDQQARDMGTTWPDLYEQAAINRANKNGVPNQQDSTTLTSFQQYEKYFS